MKTSLKDLIDSRKFDYVDSDITADKFPPVEVRVKGDSDYKLFHFNRSMSLEDVKKEMEKEGYSPATIYELLSWDGWNDRDFVVALGSVALVDDGPHVACLGRGVSGRNLHLLWFDYDWGDDYRFLAVRNGSKKLENESSALSPSEALSLPNELMINGVKYVRSVKE